MEVRIKSFSQFIGDGEISENLRYHIDNEYSLAESISRPGMTAHQWAMARVNAASPSKSWARVKKTK